MFEDNNCLELELLKREVNIQKKLIIALMIELNVDFEKVIETSFDDDKVLDFSKKVIKYLTGKMSSGKDNKEKIITKIVKELLENEEH